MTDTDCNPEDIIKRLLDLKTGRPGTRVDFEEEEITNLLSRVREVFLSEPMVLRPEAPIKICGDLHGQFYDALRIIDLCGQPPNSNYMFLGDYCDRGKQSIEVLCLLFAYKVKHPDRMHLLRGNHETAKLSRMYGFYDECKRRYSVRLWKRFCETFDCMPCAAVISDKIFCMHGGLSPELTEIEQIDAIERPVDVGEEGLLCDLLWADPEPSLIGWDVNDRGCSFLFGEDVVEEFLKKHDMDLVVRAHQVVEDGYEFFAGQKLVTIFSAPNYCGEFGNSGATLIVDPDMNCRFQLLKPSTTSQRLRSQKLNAGSSKPLTPFQRLQKKSREVKNAMTAIKAFGKPSAEAYLKKMAEQGKKPCKDTAAEYRSFARSQKSTRTSLTIAETTSDADGDCAIKTTSVVEETVASQTVRFTGKSLILQTEDLTKRNTSWGDVWEDLFYDQDELAEFRHEAFCEECDQEEDE